MRSKFLGLAMIATAIATFSAATLAGNRADGLGAKAREKFTAADVDHDGLLTRDEAKGMPRVLKNFDEIDANHDGKVSLQELAQFIKSKRASGSGTP